MITLFLFQLFKPINTTLLFFVATAFGSRAAVAHSQVNRRLTRSLKNPEGGKFTSLLVRQFPDCVREFSEELTRNSS